MGGDDVDLAGGDHRCDVGGARPAPGDGAQGRHPGGKPLDEGVVHGVLDVDAFCRHADLAAVEQPVVGRGSRDTVEVRVGQDDPGVLATQLQGAGDRPVDAGVGDDAPRPDRTRELHHVDLGDERGARGPVAGDAGQDVVGGVEGTGLLGEDLGHPPGRQGCDLAGLEHDGVAGLERRNGVTERQRDREVPRADGTDHAMGVVGGGGTTAEAPDPAGGQGLVGAGGCGVGFPVGHHREGQQQVGLRVLPRLAGLGDQDVTQLRPAGHDLAADAAQDLVATVDAERRPGGLCPAGQVDGLDDVVSGHGRDTTHDPAGGRVDDVEVAHPRVSPLRVNETSSIFVSHRWRRLHPGGPRWPAQN